MRLYRSAARSQAAPAAITVPKVVRRRGPDTNTRLSKDMNNPGEILEERQMPLLIMA
jgi:hypothetical protein